MDRLNADGQPLAARGGERDPLDPGLFLENGYIDLMDNPVILHAKDVVEIYPSFKIDADALECVIDSMTEPCETLLQMRYL